jgi:hypothetical protein
MEDHDEHGGCQHDGTDEELAEVEAMPENYGAEEREAELQAEEAE